MANEDRIPLLDIAEARRRAAECGVPESMSELSVLRVALHQPNVAAALYGMLVALLQNGVLDARLRELIIMRIGWTTGSEYEWTQHWRVARLLAVPERDLLAVRDWEKADHFETAERAAERAFLILRDSSSLPAWTGGRERLGLASPLPEKPLADRMIRKDRGDVVAVATPNNYSAPLRNPRRC